ncbi:MAG: T9SS type A sorting domain-containing protein, partial [Bacteroidales bacterium]|nr:T9SS type A sorting domain-containing protein [Bacteroidales bacterium]
RSTSHKRFTSQGIALDSLQEYTISFWVRGKGQVRTGLFDNRATGSGYATYNDYITVNSTSWSQHTQTITAATNHTACEFIFSYLSTNADGDHLQIDNVVITGGATNQVGAPVFSPAAGTYYSAQTVSMSSATEGATIYYTINGDEPTQASTLYTTPITVSSTTTLKAIAYKAGMDPSVVTTGVYTISSITSVANIGQLRQATLGETYLLTGEAILTFKQTYRKQKFIQDATGAILIDDLAGKLTNNYNLYDGITNIAGTLSDFNGMLQFVPVTDAPAASSTGNTITPAVITMNDFINNYENYESQLVTIENVTFTGANGTDVFANGTVYPISAGGENGNFRSTFYDVDYISTVIPVAPMNLTGILNTYQSANYITARSASDFDFEVVSSDATLATFTLNGINVLNLGGILVNNPATDPGATLFVSNLAGFNGIIATPNHAAASRTVKLNGVLVDEANLATQPLAANDVVLVTVTAEDNTTIKYYKVTITSENRQLEVTNPVGGETFNAGDEVTIEWTSQNITTVGIEAFDITNDEYYPIGEAAASAGSFDLEIPNGAFGEFAIHIYDLNDPSFFDDSESFTIVDNLAPSDENYIPADDAVDVALNAMLTIIFDEDMEATAGMVSVKRQSDNSVFASFAANSAQVDIDGNEVTLVMPQEFESLTAYYVIIDNGAFTDASGNAFAGISAPAQWSFTTEEYEEPELICNGDFENWTNGKPDCWFGSKTHTTDLSVVQYTTSAQSGQNAVQLVNATSTHKRFTSQGVQLAADQEYSITFWVRGQGEIRTGLFDNRETGYGYADYNAYILVNSTDWSMQTQTITAATSYEACEFIFSVRNTNVAKDHLQIDNVTIIESGVLPQVANPVFTPQAGFYTEPQTVSISCATAGASIYYTTDGNEPSQSSTLYSAPFQLTSTTTVKAKAFKSGMEPSGTVTAAYVIGSATQVDNIAALRQGTVGEIYTVSGEVVITFMQSFRNQKFIQDATAAIVIDDYNGVVTTTYQRYDGLTGITGTLGLNNNMLQFTPIADFGVASSSGNTIVPVEISIEQMLGNEDYESMVVAIPGTSFTTANGTLAFASGLVYPISDGQTSGNFRTSFFNANYVGTIIPSNTAKLVGIVTDRAEGRFITARDLNDLSGFVGLDIFNKDNVQVYPNPSNGNITIALPSGLSVDVYVYNVNGQIVAQGQDVENQLSMDLSHLNQGTYIIRMVSGKETYNHRIAIIK